MNVHLAALFKTAYRDAGRGAQHDWMTGVIQRLAFALHKGITNAYVVAPVGEAETRCNALRTMGFCASAYPASKTHATIRIDLNLT